MNGPVLPSPLRTRGDSPGAPDTAEAAARSRVIASLLDALASASAVTRCSTVRALARIDARDAATVEGVIGRLQDADPDVRVDAAAALGRMQATQAVAALAGSLEGDLEGEVRIEAARALGRIGSPSAVEPLIRCVQKQGCPELDTFAGDGYAPSWEVLTRALEALGEIGDARAADAVIEALAGEDGESMQEDAFRALARLGGAHAGRYLLGELRSGKRLARCRAARALATLPQLRGERGDFPPEFMPPLMDALLDADAGVRIEAARALAASRLSGTEVALTLLLADRDAEVRKAVATLVRGLRTESALARLHGMLAEPETELRRLVARVLGEIGNPASVAPLAALLGSDDDDLLAEVVRALGEIRRTGEEKRLAAILADPKRHHSVRALAARSLGRILANRDGARQPGEAPAEAGQTLAAAVRDREECVSQAALCALVETDPAGAPRRLVALIEEAPAQPAEHGGGESTSEVPSELSDLVLGHSAQTSTLASIFAARGAVQPAATPAAPAPQRSQALRMLAVRLLGSCERPGAEALEALRTLGAAPEAAMRREALLALGRIGDPQGLEALLAGLEDEAREVRLAALEGLAALRETPRLAERIAMLCDDPDGEVRACAVGTLAGASPLEAAPRLARALQDESREVCRAALRALSPATCTAELRDLIVSLMFRFSGELRTEAAAALRRLGDFAATDALLAVLSDEAQDERHWMSADALGELHAAAENPR